MLLLNRFQVFHSPNDVEIIEGAPSENVLDLLESGPEGSLEDDEKALSHRDSGDETNEPGPKIEKGGVETLEVEHELDEEELALITMPKRQEILAKYPDIFKTFPSLEKAMYKERAFTEIFASLDDARTAAERASTLDEAERQLFSGDVSEILKNVKNANEQSFLKIVDNFLPILEKIDNQAYLHFVSNIARHFVARVWEEGDRIGKDTDDGKALHQTASLMNRVILGSTKWQPPSPLAKPVSEDDKKVSEERAQILAERLKEVTEDLDNKAHNTIEATIRHYIDPKNIMTKYVKEKAVEDVARRLDKEIAADDQFKTYLDTLWKAVVSSNFSRQSQEKVKATFLGKARSLLGPIIARVRKEALVNAPRVSKKDDEEVDVEVNERVSAKERAEQKGRSTPDSRRSNNAVPRRGKTLDFLNED